MIFAQCFEVLQELPEEPEQPLLSTKNSSYFLERSTPYSGSSGNSKKRQFQKINYQLIIFAPYPLTINHLQPKYHEAIKVLHQSVPKPAVAKHPIQDILAIFLASYVIQNQAEIANRPKPML